MTAKISHYFRASWWCGHGWPELGKRPLTFPEALAIADALGVDLDSLVDYERIEAERELAALRQQIADIESRLSGR